MKKKISSIIGSLFLTLLISGCSTVEPAEHFGKVPLESYKSAYVVFSKNTTIGGYIAADLSRRNISTTLGSLKDRPAKVGFYVVYTDHWNWDVAIYLDSLDVDFIDNTNGQIIAHGSFKNSKFMESWPDPRAKTFEVIDSMFGTKPADDSHTP